MKSRDQILLEERYRLIAEKETAWNWEDFEDSDRYDFYKYEVKAPLKPGDLGFVPVKDDDPHWKLVVDQEIAEPLHSMYKKLQGKIVEYVGSKSVPVSRIYKNRRKTDVTEAVTVVKLPNEDTLYGSIVSLVRPTKEQLKIYNMKKELPELEGIF